MTSESKKSKSTPRENRYRDSMGAHIRAAIEELGPTRVLDDFAKYTSRQALTRFLARERIFREILPIHGSIIECGVYTGQGLMSWAQLSAIHEPVGGVTREVFGFDTFEGFPTVHEIDQRNTRGVQHQEGDLAVPFAYEDLRQCVELFDENRFLSQFPKVHLIKGDFMETSNGFFDRHPHVIPALLYLDFDVYEPTKRALEVFLPRMPRGSVIAFDEANDGTWPGETAAIYEVLDVKRFRFRKIGFDTKISWGFVE